MFGEVGEVEPRHSGERPANKDVNLSKHDPTHQTSTDDVDDDFSHPPTDDGEREVIFQAIDSFNSYRPLAHSTVHRRRQNLYALPSNQWQLLAAPPFNLLDTLSSVDDAIDSNSEIADAIVSIATATMGLPTDPTHGPAALNWQNTAKLNDHNKAQSTLRQLYRDWTAEGYNREIKPLLNLILTDLSKHLSPSPPPSTTQPTTTADNTTRPSPSLLPHILLPGAGLSRLLLSLTLSGYHATGNEISYHQLLTSNFILNHTPAPNAYTLYPFATTFTNTLSRTHQLRSYLLPDIHPATAIASARATGQAVGDMGMAAGDFCTSFNDEESRGQFDAVVTAYFIDTAPNLFRYIRTVRHCLKAHGVWVNVGPLLWHFDAREPGGGDDDNDNDDGAEGRSKNREEDTGIAEPGSFELSNEEVLLLVEREGFEVVSSEILPAGFVGGEDDGGAAVENDGVGAYIQDSRSMLQHRYRCAHWVARKKGE